MSATHCPPDPLGLFDLRQLRAFAEVAATGSFTKAAQGLHLTQSAISHSIRAFEDRLECRLFVRQAKRLQLTREGETLLKRVQRVLVELERAQHDLMRLRGWDQATVRLGIATSLCALALPSALREFRESFPTADARILPGDSSTLLAALEAREIELAITVCPTEGGSVPGGIRQQLVFEDEIGLVFSPLHPFAASSKIEERELGRARCIIYGGKTITGEMTRSWLDRRLLLTEASLELSSVEAMRQLTLINYGVSFLPEWTVRREVAEGSLQFRPLPGAERLKRKWVAFSRSEEELDLPASVLLALCQGVCQSL